ncbi:hypothetical protein [Bacillus sp. FSL K6-0067]|uniref:hypothetical protein n=1 Tax=Bacillus sp. FSL K6-0067 TaxID=2921412 RepID=UPI0030F6AE5A
MQHPPFSINPESSFLSIVQIVGTINSSWVLFATSDSIPPAANDNHVVNVSTGELLMVSSGSSNLSFSGHIEAASSNPQPPTVTLNSSPIAQVAIMKIQ